jgi:hypothetical protein
LALWASLSKAYDELAKSQNRDGKAKSSSSRRREFCRMRRTDVRRSEHEMKRNAEIGIFTKPSLVFSKNQRCIGTAKAEGIA